MSSFKTHIETAVRHFGSQAKLAHALGCSQQQISYLLKADSISVEMAKKIDDATGGVVSRHDLRPDFYGPRETEAA